MTTTTTTTGVDIYLPKGCTSIDRWKVKVGSSVRQGEVLAVASAMTKKTFATDTPFSTSVVVAAAAAAAHKRPRPKLKSKGGLAIIRHNPYTASSTSSSSHTGSSVSSSSDDVVTAAAVSAVAVAVAAAAAAVATIRRDSRKEGTAMNQPHNHITGGMNSGSSSSGGGGGDTVFVLEEVLVRAPAPGFLVSQWSNAELQQARSKYKSTATSSISIGRIEPCRHPTVLGNLCAVCGMTTTSSMTNHNAPSHPTTTHPYNNNNNGTSTTTATPLLVRPKPRPRKQTPPLIASKHSSLSTSASTLMSSTAAIPASSATTANNASSTSRSGGEGLKSSSFSSLVQRVQQQQQPPQQKSKQPPPRTNPLKLSALLRTAGGASSRQGGFPTKHHTTNENDGTNHDTHSDTNNNDMTHVTVSGGVTMKVSSEEAMSFARQTTARLRNARKLSLVLDLDHTLLHAIAASQDPNTNRIWMEQEDVRTLSLPVEVLPIPPTSGTAASASTSAAVQQQQTILMMRHYVKLRPHLTTFLQEAMEGYEISVYTAGTRTYANKVTQLICRHMVGAKVDDYEEWVAYMRRTLKEAQDVLQKAKQQSQPHSSRKATKKSKKTTTQPRSVTATSVTTPADTTTIDLSTLGKIPKKKKTAPPLLNNNHESNKNRTTSSDEKKADEDIEEAMVVKGETSKDVDVGVTTVGEDASCQKGGTEGKRKRVSFEASVNVDLEERAQRYKELIDKSTKEIDRIQKELAHAERMEALAIDLRKKIFGSRIVSRTDVGDLGRDVKSLRRVFPCGGTLATIVDDREDVWANATNNSTGRPGEPPDNLLLVRPYHWKNFLGYADVNNASGVDISSTEDSTKQQESSAMQKKNAPETEGDNERQLLWTADILKRLHARYYSEQLSDIERDSLTVPGILKQMRREVLGSSVAAARLVFSGLIPIHKQQHSSDGPKKPRFSVTRYAEELGAMVQPNVDLKTTSHVVAARDGTDKIKKARQTKGCKVVKVSWLMECFWSMTRRDETPHLIIGTSTKEHGSEASFPNGPTPSFTGTDTSADSDNSLADDFENDFLL